MSIRLFFIYINNMLSKACGSKIDISAKAIMPVNRYSMALDAVDDFEK